MFREASRWARLTLTDPEKRQHYQQRAQAEKLPNAYTAAVKEYMRSHCKKAVAEEAVSPVPQSATHPKTDSLSAIPRGYVTSKLCTLSLVRESALVTPFGKNVSESVETGTTAQRAAELRFPLGQTRHRFSNKAAPIILHAERGVVKYISAESG